MRTKAIQFRDDPPPPPKRAKLSGPSTKPAKPSGPPAKPAKPSGMSAKPTKLLGTSAKPAKPSGASAKATKLPGTSAKPAPQPRGGPTFRPASKQGNNIKTSTTQPAGRSSNTNSSCATAELPHAMENTTRPTIRHNNGRPFESQVTTGQQLRGNQPASLPISASQPVRPTLHNRATVSSSHSEPTTSHLPLDPAPFHGFGGDLDGMPIGGAWGNQDLEEEFFSTVGRQPPSSPGINNYGGTLFQNGEDNHERIGRVQDKGQGRLEFYDEMGEVAEEEIDLDPEAEEEEGESEGEGKDEDEDIEEGADDEPEEEDELASMDEDGGWVQRGKKGSSKVPRDRSAAAHPKYKTWLTKTYRRSRSIILTQYPMATPEQEDNAIQAAWKRETRGSLFEGEPFPEEFDLIVWQHNSTVRSRVKSAAIYQVSEDFGLKSSKSKCNNRQTVRGLIEDDGYTHEFPDEKKNRWFSHTAVAIMKKVSFGDRKADGSKHSDLFHPISLQLIALTFTVMRCALDEWARGTQESIQFRVSEYEGVYDAHMWNLLALDVEDTQAMQKIQKWYWKRATGSKYRASGQPAPKALSDTQIRNIVADAMARELSDQDMDPESELSDSDDN